MAATMKKRTEELSKVADEFDITSEELEQFIVRERANLANEKKRQTGHDHAAIMRYIFGQRWRKIVIAALDSDHREYAVYDGARPRLVSSDTWKMPEGKPHLIQQKKKKRVKVLRSKRVG